MALLSNLYIVVDEQVKCRSENRTMHQEADSLNTLIHSQQIVIDAYREHLDECSFISRHQVRRVTNELWIELHNPYSLLISHRELSQQNLDTMIYKSLGK